MFLQAKKVLKTHRIWIARRAMKSKPTKQECQLVCIITKCSKMQLEFTLYLFSLKIICHVRDRRTWEGFSFQCAFWNPFNSYKCVWNKFSSHMDSSHSILPKLPLKQAKDNLASQFECRKTIMSTAWETSKYHLHMHIGL